MTNKKPPLIAHVIHRLNVGGLENGLVNLINNLPRDKYQHAIVCLTDSTDYSRRIRRNDVQIYELKKKEGKDPGMYLRLYRLFRKLKPAIVHTRNLSALEASLIAAFALVPIRIHGEHGRDIYDLYGKNKRYQQLRRICAPFIHKFITMSKDLEEWLKNTVKIEAGKIEQLYNGVDTVRFCPLDTLTSSCDNYFPSEYCGNDKIIIGTVGRLEPVKDQLTLLKSFILLIRKKPVLRQSIRLVLLGDGVLMSDLKSLVKAENITDIVWLAGNRDDVPDLLRELDIFVLPSLGEGISNTILEAMASGLPIVATEVGGNGELVLPGYTGYLVPSNDPEAMSCAINTYIDSQILRFEHGKAGRKRVEEVFSLNTMLQKYESIYDDLLTTKGLN